jgi:ATP-binding cassette, subfamily B, bacterial
MASAPPTGQPVTAGAEPSTQPTWRDRLSALKYLPRLVELVWNTHHVYAAIMALLRAIRAFTPIAYLWVGRLIIDTVIAMRTHGRPFDWSRLVHLVGLEIGIVAFQEILARASILVESLLGDLFSNRVSVRIMEHAATLDLAQFEDPDFYDLLERARRETVGRIGLLTQLLAIGQDALTLASLGAALLAFNPWLMLLLLFAILPSFVGQTHFAALSYSLLFRWTPERRLLDYLRYVGASDRTAKEVQMFGLAGWLTDRYRVLAHRFAEENKVLSIRRAIVSGTLSLLGTLGYYGAFVVILVKTVVGAISVGSLTFLAASFNQSRDIIQRLLLQATEVYEQALYLRDLFLFLEIRPTIVSGTRPVPRPIKEGFVFEDVGFRYPDSESWAVRHVSFDLRPGERIALVGENGAGKTTVTKLLARLYDPTEGRITLDGVDLREYDLARLRHEIGVIFQDFVRYDMRFDENIAVGRIDEMRNYLEFGLDGAEASPGTQPSTNGSEPHENGTYPPIARAAEQSLAASLLSRFPAGYKQMLGRRFEEGVDLSGGEWQKVALARAYLRDAQLLILDEPTAALDARAEYEVFVRFAELMSGRMAVLISHRFSTVRMVDRIVVLAPGVDGGTVVEKGTHAELVARGGLYAELFDLQAAGYR